jgi:hypothetical protein
MRVGALQVAAEQQHARCHITGRPKAAHKAVAFYMRASSRDRRQ